MNRTHSQPAARLALKTVALALLCAGMAIAATVHAAATDLANEPLANPLTSTKPNIMFILDDSGSMGWQYSPDYASDNNMVYDDGTLNSETAQRICFDHKDDNGTIMTTPSNDTIANSSLKTCRLGDPPFMSPDFNKQYYNPSIRYRPGLNYDGTEMTNMDAASTSNWTAVPTDPYEQQQRNQQQNENRNTGTTTTVNLITEYPDRIWCTSQAANWGAIDTTGAITGTVGAPLCVKNSGYNYPSQIYGYGRNAADTRAKFVFGAPYYYRIATTEYCTTQDLDNCIAANADGSSPNPATYAFPAITRWCTNSGTSSGTNPLTATNSFASCQGKRVTGFLYPKAFGRVISSADIPATYAWGRITVTYVANPSSVSNITVNGVPLISAPVPCNMTDSSTNRNSCALYISGTINAGTASHNYTATRSNNVITVTSTLPGPGPNGQPIVVTSPTNTITAATATLTVTSVSNPSSITNLMVNGVAIIGGTVACNLNNNSTNRRACAQNIVNAINGHTSVPNYSASLSSSGSTVNIAAAWSLGSAANGYTITETGSVVTSATVFAGGQTAALGTTTVAFSGGADAIVGTAPTRVGVSNFTRVNIVSGQTYPKSADRADCVSSTAHCTYEEEMTNFANWYSYYRTRMQMMKSAAGRSFSALNDTFRVGLITLNFDTTRYLKIADFTAGVGGHKQTWYDKFYARAPSGGTPLREALSRVGWIYAGNFNTGLTSGILAADDPVQQSCQANYAILSTDGYWNGNAGQKIDGTTMDNQDNDDSGWSRRIDGAFDGQMASTTCGTSSTARSCGTLADVAMYYYKTDLRTGTGWDNNVQPSGRDSAQHQHMTTFTLGLGLDGYLSYRRDYDDPNLQTGDFYAIKQGTKNWPAVRSDDPSALDDLWHTAVNGRGKFFSASNPSDLATGLSDTLNAITSVTGAGAAAATSNLQPVAGDNFAFTAEYKTVEWIGDLKARTIDLSTGTVSKVPLWSARDLLDARSWTTRNILTFDASDPLGSGGNQLKHFCWPGATGICSDGSGLTTTEQAYFSPTMLTHYTSLSTAQQAAISGQKLVDYLRGDASNEDSGLGGLTDLFRNRTSVLGDIVSAQPIYVKATLFDYADSPTSSSDQDEGYVKFRTCTEGSNDASPPTYCDATRYPLFPQPRRGTVYVAANDGMLHAFETDINNNPYYQTGGISTDSTADDTFTGNNTGNGQERWSYVPGALVPQLRKLANRPYNHQYFLDGSPSVGDICTSLPCAGVDDWRTILVGGLNSGGRGYYALDITNPQTPKALWEFATTSATTCLTETQANSGTFSADCHLGLSFGNPLITKRKSDGKWVVYVTSGYNNINPGDGKGYLYMLDAYTGKILRRIGTGVGCDGVSTTSPCVAGTVDPSGLGKINGWVDNSAVNNMSLTIYGGDLKGNLWKFDLDPANTASYLTAVKLATLTDPSNVAQPVTTRPELAYVNGYRVAYLGTGKLLGTSDLGDAQVQTIYGIRDDMSNATIDARADTVAQSLAVHTSSTEKRTTSTNNSVDWDVNKGWRVDLPDTRERVNVDPLLQLGTLTVASNVPGTDACTAGGYSYLNYFNIATGRGIDTQDLGILSGVRIGGALIVGINVIQLPGGKVKVIATTSSNLQLTEDNPVPPAVFTGKRVSWRELIKVQ